MIIAEETTCCIVRFNSVTILEYFSISYEDDFPFFFPICLCILIFLSFPFNIIHLFCIIWYPLFSYQTIHTPPSKYQCFAPHNVIYVFYFFIQSIPWLRGLYVVVFVVVCCMFFFSTIIFLHLSCRIFSIPLHSRIYHHKDRTTSSLM